MSSTWRLPPELTRTVLGFLRMEGRRYGALLSACRVCKDWKVSINES
jgi:hypothetical protein